MPYLFLVTLGPVQEFIASARRTRDLHFGSWFLSEISRAAAYEIGISQKERLIFPFPENMDWLRPEHRFNVANRILALVEQEPQELAKKVRIAVSGRLAEIKKDAYKGVTLLGEQKKVAEEQIADLLELTWVALPLDDEGEYHIVRSKLEAQLAARKNTHAFAPVTWGQNVPKSSLDGHLESVIREDEYPPGNASLAKKQEMLKELYDSYRIGRLGERLSGVDLLKRLGTTAFGTNFPSTSHLAVLPFLQRMRSIDDRGMQKLQVVWKTYIDQLKPTNTSEQTHTPIKEQQISSFYPTHPILAHYDGSLLFEGRIADILLLPSTEAAKDKKFQAARDAQQKFYEALNEEFEKIGLSKKSPSTYYALLQADGDSMGDLIDAVAEQGHEQHRELSKALSRFAEKVRRIVVGNHSGALIYSGGDDVLAFLPLHTVLMCAIELQKQFGVALKDLVDQVNQARSLENQSRPPKDQRDLLSPPTLSVGVAIVHHLDSLRDVRRLASDAEKLAKHQDEKNSLAIIVSKRSGEDYRAVGKWGNTDERLLKLIEYCRAAGIPAGMPYELRDMTLRLSLPSASQRNKNTEQDKKQERDLQEIIRLETLRILMRKLTVPKGKVSEKVANEIENYLRDQLALPPKEQTKKQEKNQSVGTSKTQNEGKGESVAQTSGEPEGQQHAAQSTHDAPDDVQKDPNYPAVSINTFINELVIAQTLAEAAELAQVPMKE